MQRMQWKATTNPNKQNGCATAPLAATTIKEVQMKQIQKHMYILALLPLLFCGYRATAQDDSVAVKEIVRLRYFNDNSQLQYLLLESSIKKGSEIKPQRNKVFQLYLDSNQAANLITKVATNHAGLAKAIIPPSLKTQWLASPNHVFIAVAEATNKEEEISYETAITKARLQIDTASEEGIRSITVKAEQWVDGAWAPAADVEMKVGVARAAGGILSAGEEATYTTDSTGSVSIEYKRDSLPGDVKGNLVLVAKVEDNDSYGNLVVNKTVPWGLVTKVDNSFFNQRTLWSTRFRTPFWLLFMAYGIVIGVWGTIIYLIMQIVKIKKLGVAAG
jgi:hypothetical protein